MENRADTIHQIREFNRFYTNILGLLDRSILDSGYSLTEARILYELNESGPCIANALSIRLNLDKSYLSRILARFEKNGLVHRETSNDDGRANSIGLTAKGIETIEVLIKKSNAQIRQLLSRLSDEECDEVRASMDTIKNCFSKAGPILIRPYTDADIHFVIAHQIRLYKKEYGFTSAVWKAYVMDGVHRLVDQFDAEKDCMYILEYNDVSAGCIAITHTESKTAQLRFFFVDAAVRGLGIGRKLIDLAIEFCRRKNYQHVFLWTFSQLDAARHLYANHGFQITDTQKSDHWGKAILEERWDLDLGCVSNV